MHTETRRTVATFALALALAALPLAAADAAQGTVNVNNASTGELELLPGVGPSLAGRIVAHREKNGPFQKAEDLLLVAGIGERSFARLKPYVAVSGATTLKAKVRLPRTAKGAQEPEG